MKTTIKHLLLFVAFLLSTQLWASTFTYTGSWSPSSPSSPLVSGDSIIISSGKYSSNNFTIDSGAVLLIELGAKWNVKKNKTLINNGTILISGELKLQDKATLTNNNLIVVNSSGLINAIKKSKINNTASSTLIVNGQVKVAKKSKLTNDGTIIGTGTVKFTNKKSKNFANNNNTGSINGCTSNCFTNTTDLGASSGAPSGLNTIIYSGGTFPSTTCNDYVIMESGYTIPGNVEIGVIYVKTGISVVIDPGASLSICYSITNEGTITVESGGSLVQSATDENNNGSGIYIVKQSSGQQNVAAYNIWSSPINNADLLSVFPSTNTCGMYVFNASTQEWKYDWDASLTTTYYCTGNASPVNYTGFTYSDGTADGIMDAGRGYFIPGTGSVSTKTFTGKVNNGNIPVTVYSTSTDTTGTGWDGNDWNLIGNPYPSGVDPSAFWTTNNGSLTDGLYFWNDASQDYDVWNNLGSGTTPVSFEIAVGQGFYVLADDAVISDGTSGTISFENSMRTTTGGTFYKTESTQNSSVGISIQTPAGELNKIVVGYSKYTTNGFDKLYDAHKLSGNANIRFASMLNNEEFIIQGIAMPKLGASKTVPLVVFTAETGSHVISEYNRENIPNGMEIYLKDNVSGTLYDLSNGDVIVNLDANQTYSDRFELVFTNVGVKNEEAQAGNDALEGGSGTDAVTGIEDVKATDYRLLNQANTYTLYNSNGVNGDIQVISITGTVVWTKNNVKDNSVQIDLNGVSSGIYFIQVINNGERVYTNKIVNP